MFSFLQDMGNYESRKVGRDTSKSGIEVSTAYTSDEGYKTALLDSKDVHPVERYASRDEAEKGHVKWLKFAHDADGKTVFKLGCLGGWVKIKKYMDRESKQLYFEEVKNEQ